MVNATAVHYWGKDVLVRFTKQETKFTIVGETSTPLSCLENFPRASIPLNRAIYRWENKTRLI